MFVLDTEPVEFIPTKFKESKTPLTFIIKPPTRKTAITLQELVMNSTQIEVDGKEAASIPLELVMSMYLDECVVGWKNVIGKDQKPIPFTVETFKLFNDVDVIAELFEFCRELTVGTEKN